MPKSSTSSSVMRNRNIARIVARSTPHISHSGPTTPRSTSTSTPTSAFSSTQTSAFPSVQTSAYPTDDEDDAKPKQPFRFLDLPSEIRLKIYDLTFSPAPQVIDLDPDNWKLVHRHILPLFLVCRRVNDEAAYRFYSTHIFRVFPCHPGRFFHTKKPLLARLSPRLRSYISALELRCGPGFAAPPRGWVINEALGLEELTNVRILNILVQIDPSEPMFKGYRRGENFYEGFCADLVDGILDRIDSIREVQFDAYDGVKRNGNMMRELLGVVREHPMECTGQTPMISWGPYRKWRDEVDGEEKEEMIDSVLAGAMGDMSLASPVFTSVSCFG